MIYIEEAFKFIPREQFIVTRMEDYSKNEVSGLHELLIVIANILQSLK